ncbi:MAG: enoyl-CoA hydratase/isomerase family protein [Candidatus Lokiarchaeota archaeon]
MSIKKNFEHIEVSIRKQSIRELTGKEGKKIGINEDIAIISINRPNKLNAISLLTMKEINSALNSLEQNKAIKCVIIRGTKDYTKKPSFSTGADLSSPFESNIKPNLASHMVYSIKQLHKYFDLINSFPKPLLAAIDGYALGGGCELSLVCDIVIASERSVLGFSEINRGIFPAGGGTQRMIQSIGLNRTIKMLFFGKKYSAEKLYKWGYINFLVSNEEFENFIIKKAQQLAHRPMLELILAKKSMKLGIQVPNHIGKQIKNLGFGLL